MLGSTALEVGIGLAFMYFLFSLVCSKVNEYVASKLKWRARDLEAALDKLLASQPQPAAQGAESAQARADRLRVAEDVKSHSAVAAQADDKGSWLLWVARNIFRRAGASKPRVPSYLDPRTVSTAVVDVLLPDHIAVTALGELRQAADGIRDEGRRADIVSLIDAAATAPGSLALRNLRTAIAEVRDDEARAALLAALPGLDPLDRIQQCINQLDDANPLKKVMRQAVARGARTLDDVQAEVENYFNASMDRLSGWYKRKVQKFLAIYALAVVLIFNVDTVAAAQVLWHQPTVRAVVVAAAENQVTGDDNSATKCATEGGGSDDEEAAADDETGTTTTLAPLKGAEECVNGARVLGLPVGWTKLRAEEVHPTAHPRAFALKALGLFITMLALTLGAPFWFDTLNKLSRMRNTGKKPGEDA